MHGTDNATGFRVTRGLTGLAMVAWVYGVLRAGAVIRANTGGWPDARFLWTVVPLLAAVSAFVVASQRRMAPLWVAIGLSCGFVVVAAWSLGLFFAWSALLLLGAGVAHAVAVRAGWRVVVIPGWFAVGATGLCAVFFAYGQVQAAYSGDQINGAPIVVAGTWVFVSLIAAFSLGALLQSRLRGPVR